MPRKTYSASETARLLGISLDTLRRWDRQGRIRTRRDAANRRVVAASEVERLRGAAVGDHELSARNRFPGTVRRIDVEGLLAQVELEAGPFRVVSVITREAAESLGLEVGMPATALVKATALALAFLALPIAAVFLRVSPGHLFAQLGNPVATDALLVSLKTSAIAHVLVLVIGTPTAY